MTRPPLVPTTSAVVALAVTLSAARLCGADRSLAFGDLEASTVALPSSDALAGVKAFTIELWARVDRQSEWASPCQTAGGTPDSGVAIGLHQRGVYPCARNGGNYHTAFHNVFRPGAWFHVAYVFDAGLGPEQAIRLYVNGRSAALGYLHMGETKPATTPPGVGELVFGPFVGAIDEVRVWRKALDAETRGAMRWRRRVHRIA